MSTYFPVDWPMQIVFPSDRKVSDEEFGQYCDLNKNLRFERTSTGDLVVMPPTGGQGGNRNIKLSARIENWAEENGTGLAFDSSTQFKFPNGAIRSPDTAWIFRERWERLSSADQEGVSPIVPDFVAELRSPSDSIRELEAKMNEYMMNGVRLGILIDPLAKSVALYRQGRPVEKLNNPLTIDLTPELPGLVLKMTGIWK